MTARNLLLAERSWKPEITEIDGGERGAYIASPTLGWCGDEEDLGGR